MTKPIIGITLDREEKGGYASFPWYALRENYTQSVINSGGVPLLLPHEPDLVADYMRMIDGLIITGGNFDIDPSYYGEKITNERVLTKDKRTLFEIAITRAALDGDLPILAVCGGLQLLNVLQGGSLIQHIPDAIQNALEHEQKTPHDQTSHSITITASSLLHKITGLEQMEVNSSHHQAVKQLGRGLRVSAIAPDSVIEAIESERHRFCLGVEWHPEYEILPADTAIFKALIKAAKKSD
jgi:putative glutamine amidotransferase